MKKNLLLSVISLIGGIILCLVAVNPLLGLERAQNFNHYNITLTEQEKELFTATDIEFVAGGAKTQLVGKPLLITNDDNVKKIKLVLTNKKNVILDATTEFSDADQTGTAERGSFSDWLSDLSNPKNNTYSLQPGDKLQASVTVTYQNNSEKNFKKELTLTPELNETI